jgi:competence protein ComEA
MKSILKGAIQLAAILFVMSLAFSPMAAAEKSDAENIAKNDVAKSININTASVKELTHLPGIGKQKAEAIVAYRAEKGEFGSINEVTKVEGIGKSTLAKIRNRIVLE